MLWFGKVKKLNRENQMKTIEIFAEAVKFASEASDIPSDRILSESRDADVVDARMLVIQTLYDIGLYPRRIAEMFGMTPSNVRHLLPLTCSKCLSFWCCLPYSVIILGWNVVDCISASLLCAYAALWFELLFSIANKYYGRLWEQL